MELETKTLSPCKSQPFLLVAFILMISTPVSAQRAVDTWAGVAGMAGSVNGPREQARFNQPTSVLGYLDTGKSEPVLFVAESGNHRIRLIRGNEVSYFAGTGTSGFSNGPLLQAQFNQPWALAAIPEGMMVSDFLNHSIRKIDTTAGQVSTVCGTGAAGYQDGAATAAQFNYPRGIAVGPTGEVYIADSWNHRIRVWRPQTDSVDTWAGGGTSMGVQSPGDYKDSTGTEARFWTPSGLSMDDVGNLYVADAFNHRIRMISPAGDVTTVAGSGNSGNGEGGYLDGPALEGRLNTPTDVHWTPQGLFIADTYNQMVRLLRNDTLYTYAGSGNTGSKNGPALEAEFNFPRGMVLLPEWREGFGGQDPMVLMICDWSNHLLRMEFGSKTTGVAPTTAQRDLRVTRDPAAPGWFTASEPFVAYEILSLQGKVLHRGTAGSPASSAATGFGLGSGTELNTPAQRFYWTPDPPAGLYLVHLRAANGQEFLGRLWVP